MNPLVFSAVLLLVAGAMAQYRPFYAGSGVQYPRPFNTGNDDDGLGNRFGAESTLSPRVDAYGHDVKLVQDAANSPDELKPFWYLNRELIGQHIGLTASSTAQPLQRIQVIKPVAPNQPLQSVHPIDVVQPIEVRPAQRRLKAVRSQVA